MRWLPAPAVSFDFPVTPVFLPGIPGVHLGLEPAANPLQLDLPPVRPVIPAAVAESEALAGDELRYKGDYAGARPRYEEALRLCPRDARYHFLLGVCDMGVGERESALTSLQAALKYDPRLACAHEWISQWYLEEGLIELAISHSATAYELAPNHPATVAARAYVLEAAGELDAAWELLQKLIGRTELTPKVVALYARMAPRFNEQRRALELVQQCLQGRHSPRGQAGLHFAAASLLDGMERYDEAFAHAARANELKRQRFDPAAIEREFEARISYYTREQIHALPKATYRTVRPIFIVGMPRSGTSLVEQILATHSQVHGAGEVDLIKRVVLGAISMLCKSGESYPNCLDGLSINIANGLAQIYLEPLASLNRNVRQITDKMPLNFMYMGLIAILFPNARIIHCRRDPMDNCLSCYMANFAGANQFSFDLRHLGQFYRQYEKLMAHWKRVIDLPILDVSYEQMVDDTPAQTRRLLEFLDLPWEERCLQFHETRRSVSTASVEQVRRPIYNTSVGRWKNYQKHLGPLMEALGESQAAR
jgi:tetratricopeptide (TPR) repeat protein